MDNNKGILIYAQITSNEYIHTVFFELLSKATYLAKKLDNTEINAVLFVKPDLMDIYKDSLSSIGLNKVFYFEDKKFSSYTTLEYSELLISLIKEIKPEIMLIGATSQGRDLAPRIASSLHTGLTADCTDLDINEKGQLAATRPTFGGQLMATILSKNYPQMATVRPNVFKVTEFNANTKTEFINCPITTKEAPKVKILNLLKKENVINDLDSAKIIVAGGKGMKNKKGFELLEAFAKAIGASVGATRGAVEMGLAPTDIQIGQTGKTVSPKIYIACGISGAIQHTVGMTSSEHIIAINNDENAPIFDIADTGLVGDVFEIINEFLK